LIPFKMCTNNISQWKGQCPMEKKKRFSILKLLLVIICITSIILSLGINILFYGNNIPIIFDRVIYVVDDSNPMEGDITTGSALIAREASDITVIAGDIVLCYPADTPNNVCLRSINYIVESEDGSQRYFTRDAFHEDQTDSIPKENIVAICTGYKESPELGKFITFATSVAGVLTLLAGAGIILVIMIIIAIVNSQTDKEEQEEVELYSYEGNKKKKSQKDNPSAYSNSNPNPDIERKKMSIADNFSQKQVNPDSPYQKEREKERTMQFKAQRGNIQNTNNQTDSFPVKTLPSKNSSPTTDSLRDSMNRRNDMEKTGVYNIKGSINNPQPVNDNTGIISKSEVEQLSRKESFVNNIQPQKTAPKNQNTNNSPDISDIIKKSEEARRKRSSSDMSVDDLIKMIENEKKKL
ncbi:MAG: hypothetical protein K2O60_04285, partial [Ruminococcus sp.]|nr:hypothetical protein [Ruminococcus sp.]